MAGTNDAFVRFKEVQKSYDGEILVVKNFNPDIEAGEFVTMLGPSGSGKTTCLMMLAGFEPATHGEIYLGNQPINTVPPHKRGIGMVFQNFGLLPHKNVLDNAAYGLEVKGLDKRERYAIAQEMLEKVGLTGWENANQRELSGGMQQRVGLARALAVDPSILLMDEPFSGLDPLIRRQMREELAALQQEIQKTIIFITHDLDEAISVGDRIAIMRDGEIIQLGTPKPKSWMSAISSATPM